MAVLIVAQWRVNPGKMQEFLQDAGKATQLGQRHGARVRLLQALFAGPNSNLVTHVFELDDLAAAAAFIGRTEADQEFQQLYAKTLGAEAPGTLLGVSLVRDLPTGPPPAR
jgi:hypothetical protein